MASLSFATEKFDLRGPSCPNGLREVLSYHLHALDRSSQSSNLSRANQSSSHSSAKSVSIAPVHRHMSASIVALSSAKIGT
jgi:hypothetical protein